VRTLYLVEGALELLSGLAVLLSALLGSWLRGALLRDAAYATAATRYDRRLTRLDKAIVAWAIWTGDPRAPRASSHDGVINGGYALFDRCGGGSGGNPRPILTRRAVWASPGTLHVVFNGTFALFNSVYDISGVTSSAGWFIAAWRVYGTHVDRRYITSDPFVVTSDALQVRRRRGRHRRVPSHSWPAVG
jgi:hypothetical protein